MVQLNVPQILTMHQTLKGPGNMYNVNFKILYRMYGNSSFFVPRNFADFIVKLRFLTRELKGFTNDYSLQALSQVNLYVL